MHVPAKRLSLSSQRARAAAAARDASRHAISFTPPGQIRSTPSFDFSHLLNLSFFFLSFYTKRRCFLFDVRNFNAVKVWHGRPQRGRRHFAHIFTLPPSRPVLANMSHPTLPPPHVYIFAYCVPSKTRHACAHRMLFADTIPLYSFAVFSLRNATVFFDHGVLAQTQRLLERLTRNGGNSGAANEPLRGMIDAPYIVAIAGLVRRKAACWNS